MRSNVRASHLADKPGRQTLQPTGPIHDSIKVSTGRSRRSWKSAESGTSYMATIVIADMTTRFDGTFLNTRPLGGSESSIIRLAGAFAQRGHDVTVYNNCDGPIEHEGVKWRPLSTTPPADCDLYLSVHQPRLLRFI